MDGVLSPLRRRALREVPQRSPRLDHAEGAHPEQADRWTWLVLAAYAQLLIARRIVADRRLPWARPLPAGSLTPTRVLRNFAALLSVMGTPAEAPKPRGRSPGRPKGNLSGPAKRYPAVKKAA